ncbi:hypothetical protein B0H13DRAFT_1890132 [Mycena leptocephala]|nr:hypothetical protein B0H13DRAFT_1890132 [Mycena leptocephala]
MATGSAETSRHSSVHGHTYLRKIDWKSDGIPLTIATIKLTQLLEEMQRLWTLIPPPRQQQKSLPHQSRLDARRVIYLCISYAGFTLIYVVKVGYATGDNAANNGTMLAEFAHFIKAATGLIWNPIERRIGCLAHVINIATQKLISAYSKSPHFIAREPTAHIPDTSEPMRDEIGLVRSIAVKERSSARRKNLFKTIQLRHQTDPAEIAKQMVLDMKVRWSSTYAMLDRAYTLREVLKFFL